MWPVVLAIVSLAAFSSEASTPVVLKGRTPDGGSYIAVSSSSDPQSPNQQSYVSVQSSSANTHILPTFSQASTTGRGFHSSPYFFGLHEDPTNLLRRLFALFTPATGTNNGANGYTVRSTSRGFNYY